MHTQRRFWPGLMVAAGGVLLNGPSLMLGHRELISTYGGFAMAVLGLVLTLRYFLVRALMRRARDGSRT